MCQYGLCVHADTNPPEVVVKSPEGLEIETVTGDTVQAALNAATTVIANDIATFGCDASWSCT